LLPLAEGTNNDKGMVSMNPIDCKHRLVIDFETYFDKDYSLSKMTTQQYILDDRFSVICVAVKLDDDDTKHYASADLSKVRAWLKQFPWDDAVCIAHNAMFDGAILEWVYKIKPKAYFCTMMGARPNLVPYTDNGRMSLAAVSKYLGIKEKGTMLKRTIGMTLADLISKGLMLEMLTYCGDDVDNCAIVYEHEISNLPEDEQYMLSLTVRKFVRPQVVLDTYRLNSALAGVKMAKENLLATLTVELGVPDGAPLKKMLMSNLKFAAQLRKMGVEPPMKISPATGKETYAFAKSDPDFQALQQHASASVQALVAARLGTKSTMEETRLQRFINVAETSSQHVFGIPLVYYGAHTGRFSGQDKLNLQNLPRGNSLRFAIEAPLGMECVVADLSQVEARITAALCGEAKLTNAFTMGLDVYSVFASDLFGREITKENKHERFIGKQCILGLGFNMSWQKFQGTMKSFGTVLADADAKRTVYFYRDQYKAIVNSWNHLDQMIVAMASGDTVPWGPVTFMKGRCVLPNGMQLHYPDLQRDYIDAKGNHWRGWSYDYRGKRKGLYGGALLENIVQALARIILVDAELELARRKHYAALSVHDELIYVCKEAHAHVMEKALSYVLTRDVPWLPELTLACESDIGKSYGDAK
jgi:hypothetical protein